MKWVMTIETWYYPSTDHCVILSGMPDRLVTNLVHGHKDEIFQALAVTPEGEQSRVCRVLRLYSMHSR